MFVKEEQTMFTLSSFSIFFWTLAAIILVMLVFEEKFLALEAQHDKKRAMKKKAAKKPQVKTTEAKAQIKKAVPSADKRISRNYAA